MDLDYHGLSGLSERFVEQFIKLSGDTGLHTMLDFYKCYRAYVRGKINLFTVHAEEVDPQALGKRRKPARTIHDTGTP